MPPLGIGGMLLMMEGAAGARPMEPMLAEGMRRGAAVAACVSLRPPAGPPWRWARSPVRVQRRQANQDSPKPVRADSLARQTVWANTGTVARTSTTNVPWRM